MCCPRARSAWNEPPLAVHFPNGPTTADDDLSTTGFAACTTWLGLKSRHAIISARNSLLRLRSSSRDPAACGTANLLAVWAD